MPSVPKYKQSPEHVAKRMASFKETVRGRTLSSEARAALSARAKKHGMHGTPTYRSWISMRQRCQNQRLRQYADYGGRGIRVCERWQVFENFYADMGERPEGCTLDRIDGNGNYEPGNCRWAPPKTQSRNWRNANHRITYAGETLTLAEWSERVGIEHHTLQYRLRQGWTAEAALTTPVRSTGRE